jgi:hypothetical protein
MFPQNTTEAQSHNKTTTYPKNKFIQRAVSLKNQHSSNTYTKKHSNSQVFIKFMNKSQLPFYRAKPIVIQKSWWKNARNASNAKKGIPQRNRLLPTCVGEEKWSKKPPYPYSRWLQVLNGCFRILQDEVSKMDERRGDLTKKPKPRLYLNCSRSWLLPIFL